MRILRNAVILVMLVLLLTGIQQAWAEENKIITEFKNWKWSLGGMAYLVEADDFYYSAGVKRDLGPLFNWLDDDLLYGEIGYLNSKLLGNGGDNDYREYGFVGLSTNANFLVQCGVTGINKLLDSNFKTPELLNKVLATVGILGAKRFDDTFWDMDKGYDWGAGIAIIREW
jgi:hypothetical protein